MNSAISGAVQRLILETADSTNAVAHDFAKRGEGPIWILALEQTAARGRRGRSWFHPKGNFAATYLSYPDKPIAELPQMSFVTALALSDAIATQTGTSVQLKWPNDLLMGRRKVSGILLETAQTTTRFGLITGVGVNLKTSPPHEELEMSSLSPTSLYEETGTLVEPTEMLNLLDKATRHWEAIWLTQGFSPIREAWLARAIGLQTRITARLPNAEHEGIFEDIDETGSLVLKTRETRLVLPAADVYFGVDQGI